mmetsp:Transcript_22458/g.42822  ORF Transcript_22458/g.42822 Transcript_22458/m.42822 type:complete len:339 (+) Transcript_22458:459-1475(+)
MDRRTSVCRPPISMICCLFSQCMARCQKARAAWRCTMLWGLCAMAMTLHRPSSFTTALMMFVSVHMLATASAAACWRSASPAHEAAERRRSPPRAAISSLRRSFVESTAMHCTATICSGLTCSHISISSCKPPSSTSWYLVSSSTVRLMRHSAASARVSTEWRPCSSFTTAARPPSPSTLVRLSSEYVSLKMAKMAAWRTSSVLSCSSSSNAARALMLKLARSGLSTSTSLWIRNVHTSAESGEAPHSTSTTGSSAPALRMSLQFTLELARACITRTAVFCFLMSDERHMATIGRSSVYRLLPGSPRDNLACAAAGSRACDSCSSQRTAAARTAASCE